MKSVKNIGFIIVVTGFCLNLIPPLFKKGRMFAVDGYEKIDGKFYHVPDVFFDNVYNLILYGLLSLIFFALPILRSMGKLVNWASFILASWMFAAFMFEIFNLATPGITLNNGSNIANFYVFSMMALFSIISIYLREQWIEKK